MIHSNTDLLRRSILAEVGLHEAKYFSISMDTTPDLSRNEQLSFVVRFVSDKGEVVESLLDLVNNVKDCSAEGLF